MRWRGRRKGNEEGELASEKVSTEGLLSGDRRARRKEKAQLDMIISEVKGGKGLMTHVTWELGLKVWMNFCSKKIRTSVGPSACRALSRLNERRCDVSTSLDDA
jgi:hypothetical protein